MYECLSCIHKIESINGVISYTNRLIQADLIPALKLIIFDMDRRYPSTKSFYAAL